MRKEVEKSYQLFRNLLFDPGCRWGLEKSQILMGM